MLAENSKAADSVAASLTRMAGAGDSASAKGVYTLECRDVEGNLKWEQDISNLVVNGGLQDMNAKYFTGSSYTAAWYIGLVNGTAASTTFSGGDTLATHAGWTENSSYSGTRPQVTFGNATLADPSNINNSASTATFTMNANATIAGAFLCNAASGTSGLLFSEADFQSPGDRTVVSGDVLNVTYSFNLDAT